MCGEKQKWSPSTCFAAIFLVVSGCASAVHEADLQSWEGAPVSPLDTHPVFLTMSVVKTIASDGTEIRNYVNGRQTASCSSDGSAFRGTVSMASYSQFTTCMQSFAACNNIFYIKTGVVTKYAPVGTGGARCYTNEAARPGFRGPANIQ
jgi:hypothetical protein